MTPKDLWLSRFVLLAFMATCIDADWCHWLSWTCDTRRIPQGFGPGATEMVQCAPHRTRFCCSTEPPLKYDASCSGAADEWLTLFDLNISCGFEGWKSVPYGQPVSACSPAYPSFYRYTSALWYTLPPAWCPWDYWESWQYPISGSCRSQRVRRRRCACGGSGACSYFSASDIGTEDVGCSTWCAWSEWMSSVTSSPLMTSSSLLQRTRVCNCYGNESSDLTNNICRRGENGLTTTSWSALFGNQPSTTATSGLTGLLGNGSRSTISDFLSSATGIVVLMVPTLSFILIVSVGIWIGIQAWKRWKKAAPCLTVCSLGVLPSSPPAEGTPPTLFATRDAFGHLDELPPPYEATPEHWMQPPPPYSDPGTQAV